MLSTLIPLFDSNMAVKAYSVFTQKSNPFLNPLAMSTGINDGATSVPGFDVIMAMGMKSLPEDCKIFVPIGNVAIFTDIDSQIKGVPHDRIVLLIDRTVPPVDMYVNRLSELKKSGYLVAIRKLAVTEFMDFAPILALCDYVFLNNKKVPIEKATPFFSGLYPNAMLIAGNIDTREIFDDLNERGGYSLYEGPFYRMPVTEGQHEVAPVTVNYLQLIKVVNNPDFELQEAADIIGRDPALTLSLLKMVNKVVKTAEIKTIRHAASMLGQRELKRWINTVVTKEMCADKPSEITRLSLLRARFAENLAGCFGLKNEGEELFLMGLFSVIDVILEKPMEEALELVQLSKVIKEALGKETGRLAPVLSFMKLYETADWGELSRLMIISGISESSVSEAYTEALSWYRMTVLE